MDRPEQYSSGTAGGDGLANRNSLGDESREENSLWTVVDVTQPSDTDNTDEDGSVVEISRVSSPLTVKFDSLQLAELSNLRVIPWPSTLPWFRFQESCLNGPSARDVIHQRSTPEARNSHESNRSQSLVLGGWHLQLATAADFNTVVSEVSKFMPESAEGENLARVKALASSDPFEAKKQEFQLFVYQLSNNLFDDPDDESSDSYYDYSKYDKIIDAFRDIGLPQRAWSDLVARGLTQPTGRAFMEALFEAAINTQALDICETLLDLGADPNQVISTAVVLGQMRPVQFSMDSRIRNVELLKLLIKFGADPNFVTDFDRELALFKAVRECTLEAVKVLVEAGAWVDVKAEPMYGGTQVEQSVLTQAADADGRNSHCSDEELRKLYGDEERKGLDKLRYLLPLFHTEHDHDTIQNALVMAAAKGRSDMIRLLVRAGADVNEASARGYTPLITAVETNYDASRTSTISMLLDLGARVDGPFQNPSGAGVSAIHVAAAEGDEGLVEMLIERGADINAAARCFEGSSQTFLAHKLGFERVLGGGSGIPFMVLGLLRCVTPLQLSVFRRKPRAPWSFSKIAGAALALLRAGAELHGGELALAPALGNAELIRALLDRGADVNEVGCMQRSSLQTCLWFGRVDLVGQLLEAGARIRGGELLAAVRAGSREAFERLLEQGANIPDGEKGGSLLEAAAVSKNWELMGWLMESYDIPCDERVLCAAVGSGLGSSKDNEKYVDDLLERLERKLGREGGNLVTTAIGYAAFHAQKWLLSRLLALKPKGSCNLPFQGEYKYLELMNGWRRRLSDGYEHRFWNKPAGISCSPLVPATWVDNWEAVHLMLQAGYKADRLSLLVAIEKGPLDEIGKLTGSMELVDVSWPVRGFLDTPLQAAARHKRVDIVRHLLELGADVNVLASLLVPQPEAEFEWEALFPRTALQAAVECGNLEMIDALLEAGADVNAPAAVSYGATALQLAAGNGQIGIARKLMACGADVRAKGARYQGRTALEMAAERGRLDMVQFLLEEGAVEKVLHGTVPPELRRAVRFAKGNGHRTVARLLRSWKNRGEGGQGADEDLSSESSDYSDVNEEEYDGTSEEDEDEDADAYSSDESYDE